MKKLRKSLDVPVLDLREGGFTPPPTEDAGKIAWLKRQARHTLVLDQQLSGLVLNLSLIQAAETAAGKQYAVDLALRAATTSARTTASPAPNNLTVQRRITSLPTPSSEMTGNDMVDAAVLRLFGAVPLAGMVVDHHRLRRSSAEVSRRRFGRGAIEPLVAMAVGVRLGSNYVPEDPVEMADLAWETGFDLLHRESSHDGVHDTLAQLPYRFSPLSVEIQRNAPREIALAHTAMLDHLEHKSA